MTAVPDPITTDDLERLMLGIENAVRFLGIRPEYDVLIGHTYDTDRLVVDSVAECIRRLGAKPAMLVTEAPGANQPTPRVVIEAAKAVDYFVQVGIGPGPHTKDYYVLLFDHGVSAAYINPDRDLLMSEEARFPFELWFEIHNRLKWKISKNEIDPGVNVTFHLSDDRGSDLSWMVKCPDNIGAFVGSEPLNAGWWGGAPRPRILTRAGFPVFLLTMGDLQYSGNGSLYVDATNYLGETAEPLRLDFEAGYCTRIEGGKLGQQLWDVAVAPYPNADRLRELAICTNPKSAGRMAAFDPSARLPIAPNRRYSVGDFVVALGGDTGVGGVDPGYEHATVLFAVSRGTTLTVDGEPILDHGKLLILDDPELRAVATAFGDPDDLLSPAEV